MVKLQFARNAKEIRILDDKIALKKAKELAEAQKQKAFGVISGFMKALKKEKSEITLCKHAKTYKPFWHLRGFSEFEYKRNNEYSFDVNPEVRSVKINGKSIPVDEDNPEVHVNAEDHCFETYEHEVITSALDQKEKKLERYMQEKSKKVKTLPKTKDNAFAPIQIRASFLVNNFLKEVVKPIHADKVLTERAVIENLTLYYRPYWVFEYENASGLKRHIQVDAITGDTSKVERLNIHKMIFNDQNLFDVTAEIASNILPGAGVGMAIGKAVKEKHSSKKKRKQMQKSKTAFQKRKKKR